MAFKDLMGRTETGEPVAQSPGQATTPRVSAPARPPTPTGSTTFLDSSTVFEGKLQCADSLRIDGQVKGEIYCAEKVAIGESGNVEATIEADTVVVAGQVNGDITARRKVTLEKTGVVNGDLCTPGIVIQEGAKLEGRITIGEEAAGAEAAPRKAPGTKPETKPAAKEPAGEAASPATTTAGH